MLSRAVLQILGGLLVISAGIFCGDAFSQGFPYSVPQAPEFDRNGNSKEPDRQDVQPRARQRSGQSTAPATEKRHNYREPRPYVPQPAHAVRPPAPRPAPPSGYAPTPPPTTASSPPVGPPQPQPRQQQQLDCSQYPMLIANARSEQEMQMTARLYLTCLIKSGWPQDQARNHVIATIQRTYKAGR